MVHNVIIEVMRIVYTRSPSNEESLLNSPLAEMDATKNFEPPQDSDLRILIFTVTYFVLDGVTLTIRRLESHLRSRGALVKICNCISADMDAELTKDVIIWPP